MQSLTALCHRRMQYAIAGSNMPSPAADGRRRWPTHFRGHSYRWWQHAIAIYDMTL
jgi:hypothetical protein